MKRFASLSESGTHPYDMVTLVKMSDKELVKEINGLPDWDADLLADLIWRAFPEFEGEWEVGDEICYKAAEKLGYEI